MLLMLFLWLLGEYINFVLVFNKGCVNEILVIVVVKVGLFFCILVNLRLVFGIYFYEFL